MTRFDQKRNGILGLLCLLLAPVTPVWAVTAGDILKSAGTRAPGLCVIVGCQDGKLAAGLAREGMLVHALGLDGATVDRTRRYLQAEKLYGQATAELLGGKKLPYADNLVDLLVAEAQGTAPLSEIMRVLCPNGVAMTRGEEPHSTRSARPTSLRGSKSRVEGELKAAGFKGIEVTEQSGFWKIVKPWPPEMGDWTHTMGGPDNNRVSRDTAAGVPTGVRWIGGPNWPRGGRKHSNSSIVSTDGRIFLLTYSAYSNLEKPCEKYPFYVVAKKAFNGIHLWEKPFKGQTQWRGYKPREGYRGAYAPMAVKGDQLYLAEKRHVVSLHGETGEEIMKSEPLENVPDTIILSGGHLITATHHHVYSLDPGTGKIRWKIDAVATDTMIADDKVFFLDHKEPFYDLVCLELKAGREIWCKNTEPWFPKELRWPEGIKKGKNYSRVSKFMKSKRKKLAIRFHRSDILVLGEVGGLHGVSAKDGQSLWSYKTAHYLSNRPMKEAMYAGGLVWIWDTFEWAGSRRKSGKTSGHLGLDLKTGEIKKRIPVTVGGRKFGCTLFSASDRLVLGRDTYYEIATGKHYGFQGGRAPCNVGFLPSNGLIYSGPVTCGCTPAFKGYAAFSSDPVERPAIPEPKTRLRRGPAYGADCSGALTVGEEDWPCHRHDARRSGAASTIVGPELKLLWDIQVADRVTGPYKYNWDVRPSLGDPLTAPVIAGGKVFVALQDRHQVTAYDVKTQKKEWSFTAGGRICNPPFIHEGLCIFGAQDGRVYCVSARDGKLIWQFLGAPWDKRIMAYGQVESAWPVESVLIYEDVLFFLAGRHLGLDGGLTLYALVPKSGKLLWKTKLPFDPRHIGSGITLLGGGGNLVYLGRGYMNYRGKIEYGLGFDVQTGKCVPLADPFTLTSANSGGLLDGAWRRQAAALITRGGGCWHYGNARGMMLVFSEKRLFGYDGRLNTGREDVRISSSNLYHAQLDDKGQVMKEAQGTWSKPIERPFQIEAMLLSGPTLFVSGPLDGITPKDAVIQSISTATGKITSEYRLKVSPVFDGMAAASARLYVALEDGSLVCFGKK